MFDCEGFMEIDFSLFYSFSILQLNSWGSFVRNRVPDGVITWYIRWASV